jgi:farnesyl-diphosphate farnesyltransferase
VRPSGNSRYLLTALLRDVSRSFYLTLRVLPGAVRDPIGLAYLLARATDTIADTEAIAVEERLRALRELRACILSPEPCTISLPALRDKQTIPGEKILLERINEALELLFEGAAPDRALMQKALETITEGQLLDLTRFRNGAAGNRIIALQSNQELDDYTFRVAGCVGEFWTRICWSHLSPKPNTELESLVERGIRYGKGLQLVNILRDLPSDLRKGRCYLPEPALAAAGLLPHNLLDSTFEPRLRPVYNQWLDEAEAHLKVGWSYVIDLPFSWARVRLACAWPILIGLQTAAKLRHGAVLDSTQRIKISRREVRRILRQSVLAYPFRRKWGRLPESVLPAA